MSANKTAAIDLFYKIKNFEAANDITALSPAKVMSDIYNEINAPAEELYILATKLIDGIYLNDNSFLYGERIIAIQTISENGISGYAFLDDMDADTAYDFLLHCPTETFISLVDVVAKENQSYYTSEWNHETDERMDKLNEEVKQFNSSKENPVQSNSRLNALQGYKENEIILKNAAEVELKNKTESLISQIKELEPRISELICVGNACLENNIPLTGEAFGCRQDYDTHQFFTNSWSHLVGFVGNPHDKSCQIEFLGINGGGACGKYDFRTDGETVFSVNERNPFDVITPPIGVMQKFVKDFDTFESAFFSYVDQVIEKQQRSVDKLISSAQEKAAKQTSNSMRNTKDMTL